MTGPAEERNEVITRLNSTVLQLEQSMPGCLVAPSGANIAFAIRGARSVLDVAAVTGGFRDDGGKVRSSGSVAFGAEDLIARTLLTVMKFDPAVRSAARIRYSGRYYQVLSDMVIESREVSPSGRSENDTLMDWAVARCCSDGVPDVIAVLGSSPETKNLWLFAEEPARLASNIIILSNRIQ